MSKFKTKEIIKRKFYWRIDDLLRKEGVNQYYFEAYLLDKYKDDLSETGYFFIGWGNEARMSINQTNGGSVFIHYYSPLKYAHALLEFISLCQEHFGDDWLERGG